MKNLGYYITLTISIFILSACNTTKHVPENKQLLTGNVIFSSDKNIKTAPIYNYLKQKENTKTALFFNFHLWIYNIAHDKNNKTKRWKKLVGIYKMGDIIGEPPVILDTMLSDISSSQIEQYMKNRGYYHATVTDSVFSHGRKDRKATMLYFIEPGQPLSIDSISLNIPDTTIYNLVASDSANSLIKNGMPLDVDILQNERIRITQMLKSHGYYKFDKAYIYFQVDSNITKANAAQLDLRIIPPENDTHKQYTINNVYFFNNFEPQEYLKNKENYYLEFDTTKYKSDFFLNRFKPFVRPKVIYNASYIRKGDLYSSTNVQNSFRRLSSLNEYKLINIRYNELPDTSKLDVLVQLTPFEKHNYVTELEGTNTSGNFGVGGRLTYEHKSLFGGAEILNASIYGKLESQNTFKKNDDNLSFNSQEVGANLSLHLPSFLLPLRSEKFIKKNHPRTVLEFNLNFKDRPEYTRSIFGGSYGYYWISKKYFRHQFRLLDLSAVKVFNMDEAYYNSIQGTYLEKSFDDYLISATNYTLFFTNKKEQKNRNYFTVIATAEIAGNSLFLFSKLSKREKVGESYDVFNNTFAQYWRAELDIRFNQKLRKKNQLVYRIYSGLATPYGNTSAMPYVKQFYSGGANGLRAWPVRSLGPGSYHNEGSRYYNEAADLKFEGNIEYRFKLFWVIEGASFIDAGNIWATNTSDPRDGAVFNVNTFLSEIAIGSGLGLRFDFSFFIFRIDYGIKIRDPKESTSRRWVIANKEYNPFKSDYSMFNFGIDYPF